MFGTEVVAIKREITFLSDWAPKSINSDPGSPPQEPPISHSLSHTLHGLGSESGWTTSKKGQRRLELVPVSKTKLEKEDSLLCYLTFAGNKIINKNKMSRWSRYVEHLHRNQSITLNSPALEEQETLYINRWARSYPSADVLSAAEVVRGTASMNHSEHPLL